MTESTERGAAQPFLKWAGGKGQLLRQFEPFLPAAPMRDYYEPFVGSGAVFFHLRQRDLFARYRLADINADLITCYLAVRDAIDALIARLAGHRAAHGEAHYYAVRTLDRDPAWADAPAVERAARLIYLNKTCYNGLWRVNSRGHFNVPMGRYRQPDILNEARLRAASDALQGVEVVLEPFANVAEYAGAGDFVYFDPPYVPLNATSNFTSYSAESFGPAEQEQLARVFAQVSANGARAMLSNSDTPVVRGLYRNFRVETVSARRMINSKTGARGEINEVVVLNY